MDWGRASRPSVAAPYAFRGDPSGTEPAFTAGVSWDDAQKEAKRWIDSMNLQAVKGTTVDLRGPSESLKFQGHFRVMVLQAAKRLLKKRGAYVITPDDD